MNYRVDVDQAARDEIRDLPGYVRAQLRELIQELQKTPRLLRAKELRGKVNVYRIWLATKWRVVYEVDDELVRVVIQRVRLKEFIDYDSI